MAMKNYRVEQADGDVQFYQFDAEDESGGGKAGLDALKAAAKDDGSTVEAVTQADPKPQKGVEDTAPNTGSGSSK